MRDLKEKVDKTISSNIEKNIEYIKKLLENNSDIIYRHFKFSHFKTAIIYIDGMVDRDLLKDRKSVV